MDRLLTADEKNTNLMLHIKDMILRTERSGIDSYTCFLDEYQQALAQELLKKYRKRVDYCFWGGFENASRKVLRISDISGIQSEINDFPFKCLTFHFNRSADLSHRDFLGACMSCMIKREVIGDIIIHEDRAQIFIADSCASVVSSIDKVKNTKVRIVDDEPVIAARQQYDEITAAAASERIDAVIHVILPLSREKSAEIIKKGLVSINGIPTVSVSTRLREGDIISIRGKGKFRFKEITGSTKKGRIRICVEKFR